MQRPKFVFMAKHLKIDLWLLGFPHGLCVDMLIVSLAAEIRDFSFNSCYQSIPCMKTLKNNRSYHFVCGVPLVWWQILWEAKFCRASKTHTNSLWLSKPTSGDGLCTLENRISFINCVGSFCTNSSHMTWVKHCFYCVLPHSSGVCSVWACWKIFTAI